MAVGDSVVNGIVSDIVTRQKIVGAQIDVIRNGNTIGTANSKIDGAYVISFPTTGNDQTFSITIKASHPGYVSETIIAQVVNGNTAVDTYPLNLLSKDITQCGANSDHTVIVGRFRSPLGQALNDLPERVGEVLRYNLDSRLQTVETLTVVPHFQHCKDADEKWGSHGKQLAAFLSAHAYVHGDVSQGPSSYYTVRTYVTDAYGLFARPYPIENLDVDLVAAATAVMNQETYAAILGSVAAGLADANDCESAITIVNVAENEMAASAQFPFLAAIRNKCTPQLPHNALLPDDG